MGTQNKEIKVALDIQAKIEKASTQINTLKKQIDNFALPKGLSADFAKEFKSITNEISELQRRAGNGEINLIDSKAADKEIEKIEKRWNYLLGKIGKEGFLEKGLSSDAKALSALETIQDNYTKGIKEAEAAEAKLVKKLEEAKRHQEDLLENQKTQKTVKTSELEEQKAQLALIQKQEQLAKKARDDAEKALREKIASNSNYSMDQISQKGSGLRKTKEFRDFKAAQSAYDTAKLNTKVAKKTTESMVTKEMQAAQAAEAKKAIDEATAALSKYQQKSLETAKTDAFKEAKESLKDIAEFKDIDWESFGIDLADIKNAKELEEALAKLRTEADKRANKAFEELGETTKETSEDFEDMKKDIGAAKESLEELDDQAQQIQAFEQRIKQFLGMAGAVELLRRALRQAFETTKELDAAMTEMAVVTDLEVGDYWKQLPEHTKRASELGVAIHSVYEAETLYYQQGLKTNEVVALSNETLKMARIAGLSAEDATNKMTAALRGFNMELNETNAKNVADVYSELAAITASDVNEISSAMTKTASIASSAGMEFETTAAFLSQIIETTRESAETAGTAMKTVIARFQELKKSPDEIGEVEGEIVDANAIETALRSVGVSLRDAQGQFRDLDDVFLELSSKWDSLDKNTQRYIATIAAGSRQQSRFLAMMSDYGRTQELVTAANNSAGASQKQYEKTLESLESKLAKLKNAWDEFSMGILQSDLVKFGVDALTKLLEIINKATSAFSGLGGTITKVLTTIVMFKIGQKIFDKIKQPMMNFLTSLVAEIYEKGVKGGEAYAEGAKAGAKKAAEKKTGTKKQKEEPLVKTKESLKDRIKDKTGITKFEEQHDKNIIQKEQFDKFNEMKEQADRKTREKNYAEAKANLDAVKIRVNNKQPGAQKEWEQAQKEYKVAEKNLKDYNEQEQKVQEMSVEGWKNVGAGLQQVGGAVAGVGVGVSMLGGIFSSLGLTELGEMFTEIGNILMIVGGAISFLGSIIPAVASVASAAGISVQASWWPLLVIMLAIVATIGIIAGVMALIKSYNAQKYENRVKAAEEATATAKEAAEEAKAAYDELLSAKSGYDELQKQLDNLTRGTDEWKEALRESNAQVLELLKAYPELAKYLTRGDYGELEISDEGWDSMIADQEKAVRNTQSVLMSKQLDEIELDMEAAKKDYTDASKIYRTDSEGNRYLDASSSEKLREDLEQIYLVSGSSLDDLENKAEEIAKQYNITTDQVKKAASELGVASSEILGIAEQSENIARSYLTSMASEEVQNSEYGEAAIDAFANSMNSEATQAAIDNQVVELKDTSDYATSEEFSRLAKEYGVENEMTGSDTHDLQTLYAAVMGLESIEDIPDVIAEDRQAMLEAIATADQNNQLAKGMDDYVAKLEELATKGGDATRASNIAGLLSDEGIGMTREYANKFMTGENGTGDFNREALTEEAKALGYDTIDDWAKALGKTTKELYDEVEQNVRSSITINKATYEKLNLVLKKNNGEIDSFGKGVTVSIANQGKLAEKIVGTVQMAGVEGGNALKDALDVALSEAGDDADEFANILGGMNWNSAEEWEKLPEIINNLGLSVPSDKLQDLINKAQELGIVIDTVNFDTVTNSIQNMYDLMKSIQSGEQGRTFTEEAYQQLIASNKDLATDFVQIGDEFHYLSGTMEDLIEELKKAAALEAQKAATQLSSQLSVAKNVDAFEKTGATSLSGETLKIGNGYDEWDRQEKLAYLEQYQTFAKDSGVDTLAYLTDDQGKSLGLSLSTTFGQLSDEALDQALKSLSGLDATKLETETKKAVSDAKIASYTLLDSDTNIAKAQEARKSGNEESADEFAKALSIQATESGVVASAVIDEYNSLISQDFSKMSQEEKDAAETRMRELETTMEESLDRNADLLEDLRTVNEMSNRVAEALYNIRQNEIDKLSAINDSINNANEAMVSKIQEQIDDSRQARENEKTEQAIADDQSKLAYLMADTSGANALGAKSLSKDIAEKQENYQDNLIDQGLQKLSDDNAAAAEQRERQISLMEAQLEHDRESGILAREAEQITTDSLQAINEGTDPLDTDLYSILSQAEEIDGNMATESQQEEFKAEFTKDAVLAADSYKDIENIDETGADEETLKNLSDWLKDEQERQEKERQAAIEAEKQKTARDAALSAGVNAVKSSQTGYNNIKASGGDYDAALQAYTAAGGSEADFHAQVKGAAGEKTSGRINTSSFQMSGRDEIGDIAGRYDEDVSISIGSETFSGLEIYDPAEDDNRRSNNEQDQMAWSNEAYKELGSSDSHEGELGLYNGVAYYAWAGRWRTIFDNKTNKPSTAVAAALRKQLQQYETGGLADFTGPAWLDGTKSHPELVLNARDTANFIQLKDILAEVMDSTSSIGEKQTNGGKGDNYFNIDINVEELKDDYDVEQLANKIRSMLYEDATYRNVNAVSFIR